MSPFSMAPTQDIWLKKARGAVVQKYWHQQRAWAITDEEKRPRSDMRLMGLSMAVWTRSL